MKNKIEERNKTKWHRSVFRYSIYKPCLILLIVSTIPIVIVNFKQHINSGICNIVTFIFTGIFASVLVTMIIQKRQDKMMLDKKKVMLFDAVFLLERFAKNFLNIKKEAKVDWRRKYNICEEVALYLSELYRYNKDIFDVIELEYLRAINSSLYFIKLVNTADSDIIKTDKRAWKMNDKNASQLMENILLLITKWNLDGITMIEY